MFYTKEQAMLQYRLTGPESTAVSWSDSWVSHVLLEEHPILIGLQLYLILIAILSSWLGLAGCGDLEVAMYVIKSAT